MRKIKKLLGITLIASTLLSTSVTAREIAPTVNKTNGIPSTVVEDMTTEANTETATTATKRTIKKEKKKEKITSVSNDTVNDKVKDAELDLIDEKEHVTKELLIKSAKESDLPSNGKILSSYDNTYLVSFDNENEAKKIYEDKNVDASLNIPFGVATENKPSETTVIEPDIFDNLEEVIKDDNKKDDAFKITKEDYSIAVIDTGAPKNDKNIEVISMLDDDGYDEHGHGTSMLNAIREQDKDAKILSIKALDRNGSGDAATIYAAIKYAIERKVDVINLSISGFATEGNKIIEDVIKEAVSKGIIVVGAAGNDNLPASAFIPGGIEEAIIVGACNKNNERRSFSNYGVTVDYYANAGSTSQASAIVAGVISSNKGDINKLDDKFFKTPDLSIFDGALKRQYISGAKTDEDTDDSESGDRVLIDEEWLLNRLHMYVDCGGTLRVADTSTLLADGATTVTGVSVNTTKLDDLGDAAKNAHADVGCHMYVIDGGRYASCTPRLQDGHHAAWSLTGNNYTVMWNADGAVEEGQFLIFTLDAADAAYHDIQHPVTVIFPQCIVDLNDGSIHDWIITITRVRSYWGKNNGDYKKKRQVIPVMQLNEGKPQFITGAYDDIGDTDAACDAATDVYFTQSVSDATDGVLITGFKDLDQDKDFPVGGDNNVAEGIRIDNVSSITGTGTPKIWVTSDTKLDMYSLSDYPLGISLQAPHYRPPNTTVTPMQTSFATGMAATGTSMMWQGARCQTDIGVFMSDLISPSNCAVWVTYEQADGSWKNYAGTGDWDCLDSKDNYPGNIYTYQFVAPAGIDTTIWDPSSVFANGVLTEPLGVWDPNAKKITATYTGSARAFYLHIPRIRKSTITTYVMYETVNGQWGDQAGNVNQWTAVNSQTNVVGAGYSFTYTGAEGVNTTIWNVNDASPTPLGTPNRVISTTFAATDQAFYLYVPRRRVTYTFDGNKPSNATSNVTNVPPSITKRYGEVCGAYANVPQLKGWRFIDFFTERTNGTAYNSSEVMTQNKTFYAHWEPLKYYIRYNGNGDTNFNGHATNGMMVGEYHQNTVTGSTAYQIFTYDSIGEGLRANGFNRKGYDFVCWNTTATRTGTDYDPGYVKPANVNWIKGDGTDTPTATLDGTHTYPVIDLYAVWRQKLGTEILTIVSEETGNPIKGVEVRLTNTGNNVSTLTLTTNAQGQVTLSNNIHWFPFKWTSESVPAGYKNMQDVTFDINPANSNDNSFLTVNNERVLYMKHVKLTLNSKVSAIIDGENAPAFMYHITGQDVAGVTHSYDVMVQTDGSTLKGKNIVPVDSGAEEPYMFAGNYTVTQYDVSRYIAGNAENVSNTTPVGKNANVDLKNNTSAEVTFPYTIKQYGGFSGAHSLINKLIK